MPPHFEPWEKGPKFARTIPSRQNSANQYCAVKFISKFSQDGVIAYLGFGMAYLVCEMAYLVFGSLF